MNHIELKDLEIYRLSRLLSAKSWLIYEKMDFEERKIMGQQFIRSADSVGANIAEGYARFHFRERLNFYRISRASLSESMDHWASLMKERGVILNEEFDQLSELQVSLRVKLNNMIRSIKNQISK